MELTPATLVDARAGYEVEDGKFIAPATLDGKQWGYVLVDINNPDTSNMIWDSDIKYDNAEAYSAMGKEPEDPFCDIVDAFAARETLTAAELFASAPKPYPLGEREIAYLKEVAARAVRK